jgi:hypothetical protein
VNTYTSQKDVVLVFMLRVTLFIKHLQVCIYFMGSSRLTEELIFYLSKSKVPKFLEHKPNDKSLCHRLTGLIKAASIIYE